MSVGELQQPVNNINNIVVYGEVEPQKSPLEHLQDDFVHVINNFMSEPERQLTKLVSQIEKIFIECFKYVTKANKLTKSICAVADEFAEVPKIFEQVFKVTKALKIVKGLFSAKKLYKNAIKFIKTNDIEQKLLLGWNMFKCLYKIEAAVEVVFKYLKEFNLITKAALAWTDVVGYIVLPVKTITAGVKWYQFGEKVNFMNEFRAKIKVGKQPDVETMKGACKEIIAETKHLKKMKVINKDCPLKARMKDIVSRLKDDNEAIRKLAVDEGKMIFKRLKDRISEHVGVAGVTASVKTGFLGTSVFATIFPLAIIPVVIADLALVALNIANFAYMQFIPKGDILADEQPMLFATLGKEIKHFGKAVHATAERAAHEMQYAVEHVKNQLIPSAA